MYMTKMALKPLVYSCSGCSDVAQITNYVALELNRKGLAEMSCIAGVGGGVPGLVRLAISGREIIALDGCPMECCKNCLQQQGLEANTHFRFDKFGFKKRKGQDYAPEDAERALNLVSDTLIARQCA